MVDCYRRLKSLRSLFDGLLTTVSKIGNQEKNIRDYETKIDQENARVSVNNFERISADLNVIKQENQDLVAKLKEVSK